MEAGHTQEQAEANIQILSEVMESDLATKRDMRDLRIATQQDMKDLRVSLRQELTQAIALSEHKMTIKLGTIVSIAIGVAVTLAKLVG